MALLSPETPRKLASGCLGWLRTARSKQRLTCRLRTSNSSSSMAGEPPQSPQTTPRYTTYPHAYFGRTQGCLEGNHPLTLKHGRQQQQQATSESSARPHSLQTQRETRAAEIPTGACMPTACDGDERSRSPVSLGRSTQHPSLRIPLGRMHGTIGSVDILGMGTIIMYLAVWHIQDTRDAC